MSVANARTRLGVAEEARRYLDVVDSFTALGVDPHASARARAACARAHENRVTPARKGMLRWRS